MEDNRIQNQIAIYMTNKKLCEFTDKLKPAPIEYYKQFEAIQFRNQGYTNREIAELCGVGRKAIEKRFARIRKILSDYKEN